jgi:hypothetical protein
MGENENKQREEIFSKSVRAGKRTYFFDVKTTKAQDYYLTITESKKRIGDDGAPFFEKHKIFLYREDFQKFVDGLNEAIQHVGTLKPFEHPAPGENHSDQDNNHPNTTSFSDVNFDDLGK